MPEALATGRPGSACARGCAAALLAVHALLYIPVAAAQDQKAAPLCHESILAEMDNGV